MLIPHSTLHASCVIWVLYGQLQPCTGRQYTPITGPGVTQISSSNLVHVRLRQMKPASLSMLSHHAVRRNCSVIFVFCGGNTISRGSVTLPMQTKFLFSGIFLISHGLFQGISKCVFFSWTYCHEFQHFKDFWLSYHIIRYFDNVPLSLRHNQPWIFWAMVL